MFLEFGSTFPSYEGERELSGGGIESREMVKKMSWLGHKEWLDICAIVFQREVEGIMRNASCLWFCFLCITFGQRGKWVNPPPYVQ